jgi:hypothetical protein
MWADLCREHSVEFIEVWWAWGIVCISFWVFGLLFSVLDMFQLPSFLYKTRIQPKSPFQWTLFPKLIGLVLFNQIFIQLPLQYGLHYL